MVVNHSAPAVQTEHDLHAQQIIQKGHRGGIPSSTRRPPPPSPRAVYDADLWGPSASPPLPSPHAAGPHGPQPPGLSPRAEHGAVQVRQWAAGAGRPTVRQRDDWPAPDGPAQPDGRRGRPRRRDPPPDRGPSGPAPTRRAASRDAGPGPAQPPAPPPAPPPVPPPELLLRLGPAERPPPLWPVGPNPLRPTAFSPYKRSPASPATTAGGAHDDPRNSLPGISPRSAPTPRSGPVVVRRFPSRSPPRNPRGTVRSRSAGAPPQRPSRPQPAPSTPHHPGPPQLALPAAKPPLAQRSPRAHAQPQPPVPVPAPAPAPTQTQTPAPASLPGNAYLSYFYRHPSPAMEPVCPPPAPPPAPAPAPARPSRSRSQPPPPTSAAPNPAPGPPSAPPAAAGRPAPARAAVRKPSPSLTLTGPQPQLGSKAKGSEGVRSASAPAEIRHARGQERRAPRGPSRPKPAPLPPTQPSALSDASQTVDADLLSLLQAYEAASSSPSPSGSPRQAKAPPEVGSPASTVLAPQQSPRVPGHGRTFPFRRSASPGPPPAPPPRSAAPARAPGRVRGSSPSTPTADPRRPEAAAAGRRPSPPTATPRPRAQRPGPPPSSPASRDTGAPPAPRPPDCPPAPTAPVVASEASVETRVEASVDIPLIDISGVPDGSPEVTSVGESSGTDDAANASDTMSWRPPGLLQPVPAIIRSNSLGCETLLQSTTSGTSNSQPWLSCDSPNSRRSSGTVWEGPAHRAEDPASSDTVQSDTRRSNLVLSFNMTPETIPDLPPPRRPRTPKQMADAAKLIRRALVRFGRRYATLRQRETEGHTAAEGAQGPARDSD